jgi:hypothetical protein
MLGLRMTPSERAEIDRRAAEYRMTRTAYMVAAALDELPLTPSIDARSTRQEILRHPASS